MIEGGKDFALCGMADELLLLTLDLCDRDSKRPRTPKRLHRRLTPEKVQQRYQGWRQRVMRAGCCNVVFEMDRRFILLLHKAGYQTRTTQKGVYILVKTD